MSDWTLERFEECLDRWIELEDPSDDLRYIVTEWVISRFDDPYQGVSREPDYPNLWFGQIPNSEHGTSKVVACSYWIVERERVVRCDSVATLDLPL